LHWLILQLNHSYGILPPQAVKGHLFPYLESHSLSSLLSYEDTRC